MPDEFRSFQHTAHLCSPEQHRGIIHYLMERNFTEYLQFTPCDMWPFLRGRTLWILGDSQARFALCTSQAARRRVAATGARPWRAGTGHGQALHLIGSILILVHMLPGADQV